MKERFVTKVEDKRPSFRQGDIGSKDDLRNYVEKLLEWSNEQEKEVQNKYVPFAQKLNKVLKTTDELTDEELNELQELLPTVEKRERLSPEVLKRYYEKVKTHLDKLRDQAGLSHNDIYQKSSEQRSDTYAALYGRLQSLGNKIEKLETDEISQEDLEAVYTQLTEYLKQIREELGEHAEETEDSVEGEKQSEKRKDKTEKDKKHGDTKEGLVDRKEEEIDPSRNGELQLGDSGRAMIDGKAKIVKIIGVNRDGTLTVSRVETTGGTEETQREVVAAEDFQLFDYEIRKKLRQEFHGKKEEFAKLYKQRSHKWVGRWLGLNPRGYEEKRAELNATKSRYNKELKKALQYRAENRSLSREGEAAGESAAHLAEKGTNLTKIPGAERALERKKLIETHYNPWFIKRNVLDDATWRYELQKSKLSSEKRAVLEKMRGVAKFAKKHKWAVRTGVVIAAGATASGGVLAAGGMVGAALVAGGGASVTRGGRMLFGAAVGAGAAATTYGAMSKGVWAAENRLSRSLDNVKKQAYSKKLEEMDDIEMQTMVDEYIRHKGSLDKAALRRAVATTGVGIGAGGLAGANFDDIVGYFENDAIPSEGFNTTIEPTQEEIVSKQLPDQEESRKINIDNGTPPVPEVQETVESPDSSTESTAGAVLPDFSAEHEADLASAPETVESPTTEEIPVVDKSLANPPQMLTVPEGSSPSEALWNAYKAGELKGLPEDISRTEFINKMWAAFHAFDNNEAIVRDRMGMDSADVDFIKAGKTFNATPIIEHMNGHSLKEIESGVYEQEDLLSRTGETDRTTTPEARPTNLNTEAGETVSEKGTVAIDQVAFFEAQPGLDDLTEQKLHTEFDNRVVSENIPPEKQEAFAKLLVDRTYIEQRMDAIPVFGDKLSASEFLDLEGKWSNYDAFSVKTAPFNEDGFQEYLDLAKGLQRQDLLIDGESIKTSLEEGLKSGRIEVTDDEVLLKKSSGLLHGGSVLSVATLSKAQMI